MRSGFQRYTLYLCPHTMPMTRTLTEEDTGDEVAYEWIKLDSKRWDGAFVKPRGRAAVYVMDQEIILCTCQLKREA